MSTSNFIHRTFNEELAELYGAMLGDGCLCLWRRKNRPTDAIVMILTGHLHDYEYYTKIIQPIINKFFSVKGYLRFRNEDNAIELRVVSRSVAFFFEAGGFPIGLKGNKLKMPDEIITDARFRIACLRGIFDTDGSVYSRYSKKYKNHPRHYDYKVVQIKMNARDLLVQIKEILELSGIRSNRIIRDGLRAYALRITRQSDIEQFFTIIKPSNKYHVERYLTKPYVSASIGHVAQSGTS